MHAPHGPYRISQNGQVVLGKDVLAATGLQPGDSVYLLPHDEPEGSILVVPVEVAVRWFQLGRRTEATDRDSAPDL